MNEKYFIIRRGRYISVENDAGQTVLAKENTPEYRCLRKMLRKHTAICVEESHPWYDFVYILYTYRDDREEV